MSFSSFVSFAVSPIALIMLTYYQLGDRLHGKGRIQMILFCPLLLYFSKNKNTWKIIIIAQEIIFESSLFYRYILWQILYCRKIKIFLKHLKWLNLCKQYIFLKKCDRESVWDHSWCKCKKRPGFLLKLILDKWFLLIVS